MALLANMVTFGLIHAFSVFFKPLASEFGWSRASTAAAFSVYACTHTIYAVFCGWLTDRFGPRVTAAMGGLCLTASMILMSRITAIWELYLYFAFLFGWGVSAIYGPMMSTVSRWFSYKRGLAVGFTTTGLGFGSLVLSPLTAYLISSYGWRIAYVVVGVLACATFIPITLFIKRAPGESLGAESEKRFIGGFSFAEALKTKAFWIFSFNWLFISIPLWAITVHIVPILTDREVPLTMAGLLAGLIGGGSLIGRIGGGFLSDKLGRKAILVTAYILQGMMLIWFFFSKETWMFFVFAPLFGIMVGGYGGIIPAFPADYFGLKATGAIFGLMLIIAGIGVATGPFLGGYIFDTTHSYNNMIVICIFATIIALLFALLLKVPEKLALPNPNGCLEENLDEKSLLDAFN